MSLPKRWTFEEVLRLTYYKKVTTKMIKQIVESFNSFEDFFESSKKNSSINIFQNDELFSDNSINPESEAKRQLDFCYENNYQAISIWDDDYPDLLKNIDFPPIILFVKGQLQASDSVSISIIGTRRMSNYGRFVTEMFAESFANNGIIITSGSAIGIDTTSHLSAINAKGITYAVLAHGLDQISSSYMKKNHEKIIDSGGALISEYKFGTVAKPAYFPQRNRIISGISKALLVVESDIKGGSMITVKFALDQARDVFAVPGDIRTTYSRGCNFLIKKNMAIPALSPESVLEELGFSTLMKTEDKKIKFNFDAIEQKIFDILSYEPYHIDEIARNLEIDITDTMVKLLNMEFNGAVRQLPGKHYIRSI